jgi:RNA polymerase sigma-70 factor (sigma-E family)
MEPFAPVVGHAGVREEVLVGAPLIAFAPMEELEFSETPLEIEDFDTLFIRERVKLTRLAHLLTGSNQVGEEIVQEAFIRLHARWDSVYNPRGFLRTVVGNLAKNHSRRAILERRHTSHVPGVVGEPELDDTWAAVCRLPFRQRAVLTLRYYEDMTEAEIAEVLGCRIGTVKSAHHRAIARLREELG